MVVSDLGAFRVSIFRGFAFFGFGADLGCEFNGAVCLGADVTVRGVRSGLGVRTRLGVGAALVGFGVLTRAGFGCVTTDGRGLERTTDLDAFLPFGSELFLDFRVFLVFVSVASDERSTRRGF